MCFTMLLCKYGQSVEISATTMKLNGCIREITHPAVHSCFIFPLQTLSILNCLLKAFSISEVKLIIDYLKSWQNSKLRHEGEKSTAVIYMMSCSLSAVLIVSVPERPDSVPLWILGRRYLPTFCKGWLSVYPVLRQITEAAPRHISLTFTELRRSLLGLTPVGHVTQSGTLLRRFDCLTSNQEEKVGASPSNEQRLHVPLWDEVFPHSGDQLWESLTLLFKTLLSFLTLCFSATGLLVSN